MDAYVERLHAALTDALRRGRPRPFAEPVTVAEIYQDLVPYRAVRSTIGFEMNADYEHALLQLLSGIDGLAQLEPESAATELREELGTPNPNVGLYRKFATCSVYVAPPADAAAGDTVGAGTGTGTGTGTGAGRTVAAPSAASQGGPRRDPRPSPGPRQENEPHSAAPRSNVSAAARAVAPPSRVSTGPGTATRCGFCDAELPAGRNVRFCPRCGRDLPRSLCGSCGEALESGWRYCVSCGAPQTDGGAA